MTRRAILPPLLLMLLGPVACATQRDIARQIDSATGTLLRFVNVGENSVGIFDHDKLVLVYNFGPIHAPTGATTRPTEPHYDYIHPLYGLDGEVLTDDFPADHVHHRGVYWAWPHVKVGDEQYDLWSLRGIHCKVLDGQLHINAASLQLTNGWFVGDKQVMREAVRLVVHPATADSRAVDLELTWTPTDQPVTLSGAEGKSYGGLALRFGPRKTTVITTPTTRATTPQQDLVVTKLPWADLSGDLARTGKMSGAAVFVSSDHPDFPPTWMTRNYGMLAVGWPGVSPRTIAPGETVTCRYRIWIHRGSPSAVEINNAYEQYRAGQKHEPTTVP